MLSTSTITDSKVFESHGSTRSADPVFTIVLTLPHQDKPPPPTRELATQPHKRAETMPTRAEARAGESGPVWDVARVYYGLYDVTVDPASHCPRRDACPPCSVPRASIWTPPGSIKTALVDAPEGIAPLSPAIVSFCHGSVQRRFKVTC